MPEILETIRRWENILTTPPGTLQVIKITAPKTENNGSGAWWYLEGFTVELGGREFDAHITITKKPDELKWKYFHFTVTRAEKNHVFYELADESGKFTGTTTLLGPEGKQTNGQAHYKHDHINDRGVSDAIAGDLRILMRYLVS